MPLINMDKEACNALYEKHGDLYDSDCGVYAQHKKDCNMLYKQIFKLLVIYSCPGQYVAFNIVLPEGVIVRIIEDFCNPLLSVRIRLWRLWVQEEIAPEK